MSIHKKGIASYLRRDIMSYHKRNHTKYYKRDIQYQSRILNQ